MGTDGAGPSGDLVFDQAGNLYGTTFIGGGIGGNDGAGVVYKLTAAGVETVLFDFPETGCTSEQIPLAAWYSTPLATFMVRPVPPVRMAAATG